MMSVNKEDYLRALYVLKEENKTIKPSDIAHYLGVSRPSVTQMMQKLHKEKRVTYERYSPIELTPKGEQQARSLTAKHRIIELFLEKILHRNPEEVHEEAHRLEHAFSSESIASLKQLLGNPTTDPHGKPIP